LGSLQIDKKFIEPLKEQYKRTLDTARKQAFMDQKMKIQKMKDIQKKLDTVDERFALGVIDQQIHQKSTYKFNLELEPLAKEIGSSFLEVSNPSIYAEKAIDNLCNLLTLWDKLDILGKKRITKSIFPEGVSVDKEKSICRTQNFNIFIDYIQEITRDTAQTKKRNKEGNFTYSALVEGSRRLSNF
jgi:site-specific DNA recombinase